MDVAAFPWYRTVRGGDIEQGDILDGCPVFLPPDDLDLDETLAAPAAFRWEQRDVIVMSQSCDLVPGREKVSEVLLCPVWDRSEMTTGHLATPKGMEDAVGGISPAFICWPRANRRVSGARSGSSIFDASMHYPCPSSDDGRSGTGTGSACSRPTGSISRKASPVTSCGSGSRPTSPRSVESSEGRTDHRGQGMPRPTWRTPLGALAAAWPPKIRPMSRPRHPRHHASISPQQRDSGRRPEFDDGPQLLIQPSRSSQRGRVIRGMVVALLPSRPCKFSREDHFPQCGRLTRIGGIGLRRS